MNPSPSNAYPGEKEAKRLGYSLHSSNGLKSIAHYVKHTSFGPVHLTVFCKAQADEAKLEAFIGMVQISIGNFSFPNVNFPMFEKQLINILQKTAQKE